ncbi:hypothetical protein PMAYCL1PPCAC_17780, partial [Pristionchus mayeri]
IQMKKARKEVSEFIPLGRSPSHSLTPATTLSSRSSSRSSSVSSNRSLPSHAQIESTMEYNVPKYIFEDEIEDDDDAEMERSVPSFAMIDEVDDGDPEELRKLAFMRLEVGLETPSLLLQSANWINQNTIGTRRAKKTGWINATHTLWKNKEDFLDEPDPAFETLKMNTLNSHFNQVPSFIYSFLRGSEDDFVSDLEVDLSEHCSSSQCTTCHNVIKFNHLELVFTQSIDEIDRFFASIHPEAPFFGHFNRMLETAMYCCSGVALMMRSLITTGYGEGALRVIDWMKEHQREAIQDGYCLVTHPKNKEKSKSILSLLIGSGSSEELIMEYQQREIFNALDVEEAELDAIEMNSMDRIAIMEKVRSLMEKEMEEMEAARQRKGEWIPQKWTCKNSTKGVCAGLTFNERRRPRRETALHLATSHADGEVLDYVLKREKRRVVNGKHPDIDVPDSLLYTPMMNAIMLGKMDLLPILAKDFGATMGPLYQETVWTVAVEHERFDCMSFLATLPLPKDAYGKDVTRTVHSGGPLARCIRKRRADMIEIMLSIYVEKEFLKGKCVQQYKWWAKDNLKSALFAAMIDNDRETSVMLAHIGAETDDSFPFNDVMSGLKSEIDIVSELVNFWAPCFIYLYMAIVNWLYTVISSRLSS